MTTDYQIFGPFELPQTSSHNRLDDKKIKKDFWDQVELEVDGLPNACGCYIFAVRAGKGALPWYVGKASRQSFKQECLQSHKLVKYNEILNKRRGTPLLFLISKVTPTGKFSSKSNSKNGYPDIDFLERLFIGMSLNRNKELLNLKDTKLYSQITVPGILNSKSNSTKSSKELKAVLGI